MAMKSDPGLQSVGKTYGMRMAGVGLAVPPTGGCLPPGPRLHRGLPPRVFWNRRRVEGRTIGPSWVVTENNMALRDNLAPLVEHYLKAAGGSATIRELARQIWNNHEPLLRSSGDDFYVWQYEMRWAGQRLVKAGKMTKTKPRGVWRLL